MKRTLLSAAITICLIVSSGMSMGQTVNKETRNVKGFTSVNFGISGYLSVKIGPEFSVVLEGEKNDLERIVTEVSNDKLVVKQENWRFNLNEKVNVYITMPELKGLGVSGSGKAEIVDDIKDADLMSLNVSGSGRIVTAGLVADELNCNISGSGNVTIGSSGNADRGEIIISGSGNYSGKDFEIDHLEANISGSGSCLCKAGDSLNARISGSGNVTYFGNPKIDVRTSGSGHVRAAK
jgi:hypothetical protein